MFSIETCFDPKVKQILRPPTGILWRGVALDLEAVYRAKVGKTIVFWGFTSTTSDMSALDAFIPDDSPQRTLFSITAGLAADLGPYSAFPGEGELLIPAGTVFEVVNVKRFSRSASDPWPDANYYNAHCVETARSMNHPCLACKRSFQTCKFLTFYSTQQSHYCGAQGGGQPSWPARMRVPDVTPVGRTASCSSAHGCRFHASRGCCVVRLTECWRRLEYGPICVALTVIWPSHCNQSSACPRMLCRTVATPFPEVMSRDRGRAAPARDARALPAA